MATKKMTENVVGNQDYAQREVFIPQPALQKVQVLGSGRRVYST